MPKLRHIAIAAEDPEKMADFYKKAFDFKEVGRPNGVLADGVFLSDGTLNMAILKFKTDQLGKGSTTAASTISACWSRMSTNSRRGWRASAPNITSTATRSTRRPAISRRNSMGPERVLFDIAEHAWAGAEPLPAEIKEAAE